MAKIRENCSLVGKLNDVSVGDLILLEDSILRPTKISGYVVKLTEDRIILSHESPFNGRDLLFCRSGFFDFFSTQGNRTYELEYFSRYEILKEHNPEDYLLKQLFSQDFHQTDKEQKEFQDHLTTLAAYPHPFPLHL